MEDLNVETIQRLAEPILADASTELVELTVRRHGGRWLVRLLVDKVGGVTIQDCARLNRMIGEALEQSAVLDDSYTLEVSSPGLDRPLTSKRDYERAIGEQLEVHLIDAVPGRQDLEGMLLAVQEEAIVLTTRSGNLTLPFAHIRAAKKAVRF